MVSVVIVLAGSLDVGEPEVVGVLPTLKQGNQFLDKRPAHEDVGVADAVVLAG